ncbi:unnamed protein product [Protopolystoma xenopodis]|uniref:Uncharacterized protein n=1 Tax=Protopolystoma xenopodis TaxID=117903 RepID=A0A448XF23_9PLAT|nr:unnamed protein product [Protopolystoma xenopodis]
MPLEPMSPLGSRLVTRMSRPHTYSQAAPVSDGWTGASGLDGGLNGLLAFCPPDPGLAIPWALEQMTTHEESPGWFSPLTLSQAPTRPSVASAASGTCAIAPATALDRHVDQTLANVSSSPVDSLSQPYAQFWRLLAPLFLWPVNNTKADPRTRGQNDEMSRDEEPSSADKTVNLAPNTLEFNNAASFCSPANDSSSTAALFSSTAHVATSEASVECGYGANHVGPCPPVQSVQTVFRNCRPTEDPFNVVLTANGKNANFPLPSSSIGATCNGFLCSRRSGELFHYVSTS